MASRQEYKYQVYIIIVLILTKTCKPSKYLSIEDWINIVIHMMAIIELLKILDPHLFSGGIYPWYKTNWVIIPKNTEGQFFYTCLCIMYIHIFLWVWGKSKRTWDVGKRRGKCVEGY